MSLVIGLDFGSSGARAILMDAVSGATIASAAAQYAHGDEGVLLSANDALIARQEPADFVRSMEEALASLLNASNCDPSDICAIGIATTGSTPLAITDDLMPLAEIAGFEDNLHAKAWMWKDHSAHAEAAEIVAAIEAAGVPYLAASGGAYSSEWFWAKLLRFVRVDTVAAKQAATWVELQDYLPAILTGVTRSADIRRGICAAGHKGMFSPEWGGYPAEAFLGTLHPELARFAATLPHQALPASEPSGILSAQWSKRLGLGDNVIVCGGILDAHAGAIGVGVAPGRMVKIMGTSSCDIGLSQTSMPSAGIAGVVQGSVIPGLYGIETGQAAVGDLFAWAARMAGGANIAALSDQAAALLPGESGLLALDWNNGNRSILMNSRLSGLMVGQTLQTGPAEMLRAMIEATAFGSKIIICHLNAAGMPVSELVMTGGIAAKNPLVAQVYADVLDMNVLVDEQADGGTRGAAMLAAVAAGLHDDIAQAQAAMVHGNFRRFTPSPAGVETYRQLFDFYRVLHDSFGLSKLDVALGAIMPGLMTLRAEALALRNSHNE